MTWISCGAVALGIFWVLTSGTGCRSDAPEPDVELSESEAREIADALAQRLTRELMQRLQQAVEQGGIEEAARVCSDVAQTITSEAGVEHGAVVRRTALRLRNPKNRPDAYERRWLERQQERVARGETAESSYESVEDADGRALRHLRPILFPGGLCAQCHGTANELAPDALTWLRERYPEDQAIDFVPGDLRGAISVRVPLATAAR